MKDFINPTLRLAKYALSTTKSKEETDLYEEFSDEERKPLLPGAKKFMHPALFSRFNEETHEMPSHLFERSASVGPQNWMEEFQSMNLPSFSLQYIQLFHVPLDVMHECLRLQAELGTELSCPSPHSIKQVGIYQGKNRREGERERERGREGGREGGREAITHYMLFPLLPLAG